MLNPDPFSSGFFIVTESRFRGTNSSLELSWHNFKNSLQLVERSLLSIGQPMSICYDGFMENNNRTPN